MPLKLCRSGHPQRRENQYDRGDGYFGCYPCRLENARSRAHRYTEWRKAYSQSFYLENREAIRKRNNAWRDKNKARFMATARLRYLRIKEQTHGISEGEVEQMLEIAAKYPRRR